MSEAHARHWRWDSASGGVLIIGLIVRFAIGGGGIGDRSATLLAGVLTLCALVGARIVGGPRVALLATVACVAVFNLGALRARNVAPYDDVLAFYRTDQTIAAQVNAGSARTLTLTTKAVFNGATPQFGLDGDINGVHARWECAFQRGVQQLVLPLPSGVPSGQELDVQLHLSGSPSRESDYLLVYQSSRRGGFLIGAAEPTGTATSCVLL